MAPRRNGSEAEAPESGWDRGAFFDVDGTLVSTNVVHAYGYYVLNRGTLFGAAGRLLKGLAMAPLYAAADAMNRKVFNELFYRSYRGLSEDRLIELAENLCEEVLQPAVFPGALDILAEARRAGCKIVLCTGAIDITMRPLARYLGADDLIANSLQFVEGFATGKVIPPIVEGAHKARRIRDYCVEHGLKLDQSHAYSDSLSDYPMLAVVGHPTAINPDGKLRAHARAYEWPILNLR
ncbi:MAG TPA: HAD family phosphatase [Myxococcales bacterium]|jgi:HAD superfamily hydrolase (TIGR01490 family)|nr:HAD family phosphatase [Myxococcales bacterium]